MSAMLKKSPDPKRASGVTQEGDLGSVENSSSIIKNRNKWRLKGVLEGRKQKHRGVQKKTERARDSVL